MSKGLVGRWKSMLGLSKERAGQDLSFELLFRSFREVIESNNRALEIITDMGEKLGGDYLFDIIYIKSAYSKLSDAVKRSMESFDALTRKKHLELHGVFDRIDQQIRQMVYSLHPARDEMVVFYEDITWDMARKVGGKNASLAELKNHLALRVPDAFVITTHAFDELITHNSLDTLIQSLENDAAVSESALTELRNLIMHAEIPPDLDAAIDSGIEKIKARCGERCFLAVRSSAEEEDGEFSFAGQFETVLNVPLEGKAVKDASKKVIASLFSPHSVAYQRQHGYHVGKLKMAVGCMVMVDAVSSGVMYSTAPNGDRDMLLINATWGLGKTVVEGQTDGDLYKVKKSTVPEIIEMKQGRKESMIVNLKEGGTDAVRTPEGMRGEPCLKRETALELSRLGVTLEKHSKRPQDIEWAVDKDERIYLLQSRPLRIQQDKEGEPGLSVPAKDSKHALMNNKGIAVQKGVGIGRVFILRQLDELENVPKGSVLVSKYDSSNFVRIMPYLSAIITDVGTPTSHMASLCREFRVPTIVNAADATQVLSHGQEVTVTVGDEENTTVYEGIVKELAGFVDAHSMQMEDIYEFRKKRYILRYISPLNLIDPFIDNFTTEGCKTLHDVLRFIHEKSVMELVDRARYGNALIKKHAAVKLDLPIPAGIIVIDIGGGLNLDARIDHASFEQLSSAPLRAIIKGMLYPGIWHADAVSLRVNDFLSSMMRMPDITSDVSDYVGYNVAVVSKEYVNLSLKFGYHFTMIDSYCSETARNNHIYFRFVGGATDITKRSRRIQLIADILKEYGFNLNTKGDLLIARLANVRKDDMEDMLDQMGRLIAYTRQLDAVLHDDSAVVRYAKNFLEGNYEF
ncbi:MAG: PEP-utilizing enzyme [Nitrospirae bacterium]|nr:PEP-utilizing enzyme [Nitrospirota bacterium]MCL5420917.1 PEP-utilizing enzyme [Nitrospirota bacterium]